MEHGAGVLHSYRKAERQERKAKGSVTKGLLSSTASKAHGSASCYGSDCERCVSASPLGGQCPSLPLVSCTYRCSGQGCTATFLLRFPIASSCTVCWSRVFFRLAMVWAPQHDGREVVP